MIELKLSHPAKVCNDRIHCHSKCHWLGENTLDGSKITCQVTGEVPWSRVDLHSGRERFLRGQVCIKLFGE